MKTLQTQYNLIKEGKGDKAYFMKLARYNFPDLVTPVLSYNDTVTVLKNKSILSEGIGGVVTKGKTPDWHQIFKDNITEAAKAEEKETTKEVTDMVTRGYDYKDEKNYDNVFGEEFLKGYYTEMKDPKNEGKHVEELRQIVAKNLAKDVNHYVKDGQFGTKGVGYTTEAPGLGTPKEAKGKHKASGYGDLKESVLRSQIYLLVKEVLAEEENDHMGQYRLGVLKQLHNLYPDDKHLKKELGIKDEFEVGDTVTYEGEEYKITRFSDDGTRIYIKSLKYGGRPDSWVKASDLQKEALAEADLPSDVTNRIAKGEKVDDIAKDFPNVDKKAIEKAYVKKWNPKFKKGIESGDIE